MEKFFVKAWQETVTIPTYGVGEPDKNPMFFENRVYQGSSGVVYPNPIIEKIYDEKHNRSYTGLFLENPYLKIMILPALGGRVQMAYDKIGKRHFIYYNQVIKPALVGLCGPWISGGIEFNWPQHHRPSTFEPVDHAIEEHEDGSKTVWVNEVEKMFGTKGMAGFTLHPDKAYLEIKAKLYNRTALPQTFLWWANPAVKVNDHYQSVFPPDVHAVFDHGKRDVSSFPIADGTYYKVDYSPGTDISRYKNIPVPTSYMAIRSAYDFMGGYEHDSQAGVLHVADHHVSPGKKQWTWGHGDFGIAWDRNLTDEDGPYIELMAGVFTDNQPDFSWLMPYEEKTFTQYFLPYRALGVVKNATRDILVNMEQQQHELVLQVFATSEQSNLVLRLLNGNELLLEEKFDASPEKIYRKALPAVTDASNIRMVVLDEQGAELISFSPQYSESTAIPEPARAALQPKDIASNEQLYLTGLHLEQYRHATCSPVPYYEEALRREPADIRNNNALGLWYMRRGQFAKSEPYFRKAIETLVQRNPNPYDGEPYYNLGVCLKWQNRNDEAYDAFYKATWNKAWQDSGFFSLAQIDCARKNYGKALGHIQSALDRNMGNNKAHVLKSALLRKRNCLRQALDTCHAALQRDRFNLAIYFEQHIIHQLMNDSQAAVQSLAALKELARGDMHNYAEYALDYAGAGLYEEAIQLLELAAEDERGKDHPMIWYYLGWISQQKGNDKDALSYYERAASIKPRYHFFNRLNDIAILGSATAMNPADAYAPYYLGNLWYDKRQYNNAIGQWELCASRNSSFPTVWRNLGIAFFNKKNDHEHALSYYEKAFSLDVSDARVLMELDQLYKRLNRDPEQRLRFLEQHMQAVEQRDDLYLERAALYNLLGRYNKAYELIMQRKFHPWEGGEGRVSGQYIYSLVEMARKLIGSLQFEKAIALLQQAQHYPEGLGEGKLYGAQENDIFYWMGCAYEGLNMKAEAEEYFTKATQGLSEPAAAMFYNDQPPGTLFYQGLAWEKLHDKERARHIFVKLVEYGKAHMADEVKIDYFAVSLPDLLIFEDDLSVRNKAHCSYMMALGYLGLQKYAEAINHFKEVLAKDAMHFGAQTHLAMAKQVHQKDLV